MSGPKKIPPSTQAVADTENAMEISAGVMSIRSHRSGMEGPMIDITIPCKYNFESKMRVIGMSNSDRWISKCKIRVTDGSSRV